MHCNLPPPLCTPRVDQSRFGDYKGMLSRRAGEITMEHTTRPQPIPFKPNQLIRRKSGRKHTGPSPIKMRVPRLEKGKSRSKPPNCLGPMRTPPPPRCSFQGPVRQHVVPAVGAAVHNLQHGACQAAGETFREELGRRRPAVVSRVLRSRGNLLHCGRFLFLGILFILFGMYYLCIQFIFSNAKKIK